MRRVACLLALALPVAACGGGSSRVERPCPLVGPRVTSSVKSKCEQYATAVARDLRNKDGWYGLGVVAIEIGDFRAARSYLHAAIEIDPKFEAALFRSGIVSLWFGDNRAAVTYLRRATAVSPDDANAWQLLAYALSRAGPENRAAAAAARSRAHRLNPSLPKLTVPPTRSSSEAG